jgi:hypothetical protein
MSEYKGYNISTTTLHVKGPGVTGVGYCVRYSGEIVQQATVPGPFDSMGDARSAGELAAHGWVDRQ